MKTYEFVRLDISLFGSEPRTDYKDVIKEYATRGWKFVQVFAPPISGYGRAKYYELIFEKDTN